MRIGLVSADASSYDFLLLERHLIKSENLSMKIGNMLLLTSQV